MRARDASGGQVSRGVPGLRRRSLASLAVATVAAAVLGAAPAPPPGDGGVAAAPLGAEPRGGSGGAGRFGASGATVGCPVPEPGFVVSAPGAGKTVALTFDDGPGVADLQIAEVLGREQVPGTFFFTGAGAAAHPDVVRQIAGRGLAVGNHSYDHRYPSQVPGGWTQRHLTDQQRRTNAALTHVTGLPVCLFRPPGGFRDGVLAASRSLGMASVLWSVDPRDWAQPAVPSAQATDAIATAATDIGTQTHPIVLLHSSQAPASVQEAGGPGYRGNTVAALPRIIVWYRAHGFRFVDLQGRSAP